MDALKFLHFVCILFCFFSYYTLVNDSHETVYERANKTLPLQYLACKELRSLYPSKSEIDLEEFPADFLQYLLNTRIKYLSPKNRMQFQRLVLKPILAGRCLIINEKACLVANEKDLEAIDFLFSSRLSYVSINMETFDSIKMARWDFKIDQLTVVKKGPPYSDCEESNSRFFCLNDCFKKSFRLSRYLYNSNENGSVRLYYGYKNQAIRKSEQICFGICKKENCKLVKLIAKGPLKTPITETVEARAKLSDTDYWLQLIGLAFSFIGISFKKSKVKRRKIQVGLFCLNLFITFLSLAYGGYLGAQVILEESSPFEKEMARILIQPKILRLAVCVHAVEYFGYSVGSLGHPDEKPCVEIRFEETDRTSLPEFDRDRQTKEIDLQYDVKQFVEEIPFSYKLTLDLIVISTNAANYSTLILSLLSLLCTWFEVDVLVLRPLYLFLRDYLFGYLFIYLPVCLFNRNIQFLLAISKWLGKLKSILDQLKLALCERLNLRNRNSVSPALD
ncbi:hypothetical protein L1887_52905 [Cichorium endivia]|nr:hypothetical protein L1887_52905 [Cichorium endivia]